MGLHAVEPTNGITVY